MVGEKRLHPNLYSGGCSCSDNEGWVSGFDWDTIRWGGSQGGTCTDSTGVSGGAPRPDRTGGDCDTLFGSAHPAGAMFALCDGSVRMFRFEMDAVTFARLCQRNDGVAVSVDN
jgi:hypothetical protein